MDRVISNGTAQRHAPYPQNALRHAMGIVAVIGLSLLVAMPASAATRTWSGAVNTNWNNASNWDGPVPVADDAVVIPDRANDPTMPSSNYPASGAFLSFEVQAGAIVTCLGDTNAINVPSGGIAALKHGTGVAINCGSALINGTLNADSCGFYHATLGGVAVGYGGPGCSTVYGTGGTYGGKGGCYYPLNSFSLTSIYGSFTNPTALGSAGSVLDNNYSSWGGGAIRLNVTGTLTLNGTITACAPPRL